MEDLSKEQVADETVEDLDLANDELQGVAISDDDLESADKAKHQAHKQAKKTAKLRRSAEEKQHLRRRKRLIITVSICLVAVLLLLVPYTRWPILNAVGLRRDFVVTVIEQKSQQPLEGVVVRLDDNIYGLTDSLGQAIFHDAKLGNHKVGIKKPGYSELSVLLGNNLGGPQPSWLSLKAIGIKLDLVIKDWLSGEPIDNALVKSTGASAKSNQAGEASIIVPPTSKKKFTLKVSAPGYITQTVSSQLNVSATEVSLVRAEKNYFISRRDGKFDIFSSNIDGTAQHKIIEATGSEDPSILQFSINANNKQAILVANREGKQQNNSIIAGIYAVDLEAASLRKIDEGGDVRLLDWSGSTIAYTKTTTGLRYDDPKLTKLITYNIDTKSLNQITEANYISVGLVAQNKLFYQRADAYHSIQDGMLTSLDLITGNRQKYLEGKQLYYLARSSYDTLATQLADGGNREIQISSGLTRPIDGYNGEMLVFVPSPDGKLAAWSDRRDGQGALFVRSLKDSKIQMVVRAGGLTQPVRLLSSKLAVVRIVTTQETADYVVSLVNGHMRKIVDVSNIGSLGMGIL